jgi:hypothetical protein
VAGDAIFQGVSVLTVPGVQGSQEVPPAVSVMVFPLTVPENVSAEVPDPPQVVPATLSASVPLEFVPVTLLLDPVLKVPVRVPLVSVSTSVAVVAALDRLTPPQTFWVSVTVSVMVPTQVPVAEVPLPATVALDVLASSLFLHENAADPTTTANSPATMNFL